MLDTIVIVLVFCAIFQIKHFFCDYIFQNRYMLGKFKDSGWLLPLSCHCAIHSVFTFVLIFPTESITLAIKLSLFDFVCHFVMDRIKAGKTWLGRWHHQSPFFWWTLGLDQMVHHLTHYAIIYVLLTEKL